MPAGALTTGWVTPVASGITATGASAQTFSPQAAGDMTDRTLWLSAVGVGAVPTAVTVDLEGSTDGGTTWQKVATGLALVTAGAATMQKVTNIVAAMLLRINPTTVTLGGASSVTVNAQLS